MLNLKKKNKKPQKLKPKISERNKIDVTPRAMGNKIHPNLPEPEIVAVEYSSIYEQQLNNGVAGVCC